MSLKVMTWAWTVPLPPSPKFVLMALADEADDSGFCFPSHRRIAQKCSITERSVRRLIRLLATDRYLVVQQRFNNRARTSNGYQLAVDHPRTNCPGVPDITVRGDRTASSAGSGRSCPGALDIGVRVTTTYPLVNPTPPLQVNLDVNPNAGGLGADTDRGSGELCFPRALSDAQRQALLNRLSGLSKEAAQQLIDELAGRMNSTHVRNPIGYCAALMRRFERGEFHAELGLQIAEERHAARQRKERRGEPIGAGQASANAVFVALPEAIRASLERMRRKSRSVRTECSQAGILPSTPGADGKGN
jgi:hypothetical protein